MYFDAQPPILDANSQKFRPARLGPSVAIGLLASIVFSTIPLVCGAEPTAYRLAVAEDSTSCQVHRLVLEVQGHMKWKAAEQGERQTPVSIRGEQTYGERRLAAGPASGTLAARHYFAADVQFRVGNQSTENKLPEGRRLVLATLSPTGVTFISPQEPLTRTELDLLDVPGCSLALPGLLPQDEVEVGATWAVTGETLAKLLGLSHVSVTDVQGKFVRVEQNTAVIEYTGDISGRSDGAGTRIELQAKLNYDLTTRQIAWFTASMREKRDISDTQPGLDVLARLRMVSEHHAAPVAELSDAAVAPLAELSAVSTPLVRTISREGGVSILHDPDWRVIVDRHDVLIMRLFDEARLIAQVVITPLADGPPGKHLGLRPFEEEALLALKAHAGQIVESAEGKSEDGLTVLRVTAAGVVSEVSMQWVYYHVSDDTGRRAGLTFTVQTDLIDQFAERDRAMVENFVFEQRAATSTTAPAAPPAASKAPAEAKPAAEAAANPRPIRN